MTPGIFQTLPEKVAPAHTAVLVIDVVNDYFSEKGGLAARLRKAKKNVEAALQPRIQMLPKLQELLDVARRVGIRIVWTKATEGPEQLSDAAKELMARHGHTNYLCVKDSWGADFFEEMRPKAGEAIVEKHRYSAFIGTNLDALLKEWRISTIVLTGVGTNVCVESTARDAFMMGDYYVVLVSDLVSTSNPELHSSTLVSIDNYFGQVVTSEELLKIWDICSVLSK